MKCTNNYQKAAAACQGGRERTICASWMGEGGLEKISQEHLLTIECMGCSRCLLDSGEPTSSVAEADVCLGVLESGLELL